jgi:hypothetical protein
MMDWPESTRRMRTPKYAPLVAWLEELPADQDRAELTLSEIAQIIGQPLPGVAGTQTFWTRSLSVRYGWQSAGFSAWLNHYTKVVTFTRLQAPRITPR